MGCVKGVWGRGESEQCAGVEQRGHEVIVRRTPIATLPQALSCPCPVRGQDILPPSALLRDLRPGGEVTTGLALECLSSKTEAESASS